VNLLQTYARLGAAARLDDRRASSIVSGAMPFAVATLGLPGGDVLPVSVRRVSPEASRGGSLIPAWPMRQSDDSVVIEYVEDWGALLAGWLTAVGDEHQDLAAQAINSGQRVWIGIANDVMQLFVPDPPEGAYSMVRHHALMLAAATAWLGPDAIRAWGMLHKAAGANFIARYADQRLWTSIEAAESGLAKLLADERAHAAAPLALTWLDRDATARSRYVDFLGAASLGVAAVLDALAASGGDVSASLARATAELHSDPDFNRAWIEEYARRVLAERPLRQEPAAARRRRSEQEPA
jgi:hypothetical protein